MPGLLRFCKCQRNEPWIATHLSTTARASAARDGICASPRVRLRRRGPAADGSCVLPLVQAANNRREAGGACYCVVWLRS